MDVGRWRREGYVGFVFFSFFLVITLLIYSFLISFLFFFSTHSNSSFNFAQSVMEICPNSAPVYERGTYSLAVWGSSVGTTRFSVKLVIDDEAHPTPPPEVDFFFLYFFLYFSFLFLFLSFLVLFCLFNFLLFFFFFFFFFFLKDRVRCEDVPESELKSEVIFSPSSFPSIITSFISIFLIIPPSPSPPKQCVWKKVLHIRRMLDSTKQEVPSPWTLFFP